MTPVNPFRGTVDYSPADFLSDVEAIDRMLAEEKTSRLPEPEPITVLDEHTGLPRQVRIDTSLDSYRVYAYFVDKYGEPGLRRHVIYFGVMRYLVRHRRELLREGLLRREGAGLAIDEDFLRDLLARPAESFL